jgi:hypothetical protein
VKTALMELDLERWREGPPQRWEGSSPSELRPKPTFTVRARRSWEQRRAEGKQPMMIHVAAVSSADGVHFLTAAHSAELLTAKLVEYVKQQVEWSLQFEEVTEFYRLLDSGEPEDAVRYYFERVGGRWGKESLSLEVVPATLSVV